MAARFDDAERAATEMFELGNQIGESDVFSVFAAQIFVVATFAGRHADLLSLVEQSASANPDLLVFRLAFGIICTSVGRHDEARPILAEGVAQGFRHVPPDLWWMTTVISYAIIAIEVEDASAAAFLLPLIEPSATEVSFNGATSQGPISAYVGKLHSLLGHHEHADTHLRAALATATSFGWHYHRATALIDLGRCRFRCHGRLDDEALSWLDEAFTICIERGIKSWAARIADLRHEAAAAAE